MRKKEVLSKTTLDRLYREWDRQIASGDNGVGSGVSAKVNENGKDILVVEDVNKAGKKNVQIIPQEGATGDLN